MRGITNAAGDSVYVGLGTQQVNVTGFAPRAWGWANEQSPGGAAATLSVQSSGLYTLSLWMREDGLQLDRLLLTTDTTYLPTGFGPAETARLTGTVTLSTTLDRVITYDYDALYRLTEASYSSGELYEYTYDPVGNRLKQVIDGDTTDYLYDAANRLASVDGQSYTFDDNGNLLNTGVLTNTFDAANRLISSSRAGTTVQPLYNGVGDRVGQTVGVTTTHFALDVAGLPEVIYTSEDEVYLHLPGVIVTEKAGEVRYLLSDGLGSVRQVVDEEAELVAYNEFDPYGNPVNNTIGGEPYGYTGEWWQSAVNLLHLRARWYAPQTGTFLQKDPHPGEASAPMTLNGYNYVHQNPVNLIDPSGKYVGPVDGYVEGLQIAIALPSGVSLPNFASPIGELRGISTGIALWNVLKFACFRWKATFLWPRNHQAIYAKEVVYDFKHLQSAQFRPAPRPDLLNLPNSWGTDASTSFYDMDIYASIYAGPIVGLAGKRNIIGYTDGVVNGLNLGLSGQVDKISVGGGVAVNTSSSDQVGVLNAFSELGEDARSGYNIQVTSVTFGGSIGVGTASDAIATRMCQVR